MPQEEYNAIMDKMMELYHQNQIDELVKIRDDKSEIGEKRVAASMVLQMPRDPRRNFIIED